METVIAFYMPPEGGAYEKSEMHRIDFEAAKAHPKFGKCWSLEPPTAEGAVIHDRTPPKLDLQEQVETHSAAPLVSPPVLKRRQGLNPI
jgi:hypothetical protein